MLNFESPQKIYVMGILNVTPDSFSDGGHFLDPEKALDHALRMEEEGADLIDLGAESTRPGAQALSLQEESSRLKAVLSRLTGRLKAPLSIDTRKAAIAQMAVEKGVALVNDVSGFSFDPEMIHLLKKTQVKAVLMHSRGTPETMGGLVQYDALTEDLTHYFEEKLSWLEKKGIPRDRLILDPGIGFAKTASQSMEILSNLSVFKKFHRPLLLGLSRKSFLKEYFGQSSAAERGGPTEIAHALAILNGVTILRVHDVGAAKKTIRFVKEFLRAPL